MKKKIPNQMTTLLYIIVGIILAFLINQCLVFALGTNMPIVAVESNSMVPTFQRGDILILQGVSAGEIKIGDIIVFSPEDVNTPIVHRVIKINPDNTFQTKGDANDAQLPFEKKITPKQIHGKSILIIPYLGWIKIAIVEYLIPNIIFVILAIITLYISFNIIRRR